MRKTVRATALLLSALMLLSLLVGCGGADRGVRIEQNGGSSSDKTYDGEVTEITFCNSGDNEEKKRFSRPLRRKTPTLRSIICSSPRVNT